MCHAHRRETTRAWIENLPCTSFVVTQSGGKYGSNEATPEATVAWLWGFGAGLLVGATTGVLLMYLLVVK